MSCFGAASPQLERFASGFCMEVADPYLRAAVVADIARRHERSGSRRRDLPSELMAWLVIGAGLLRDQAFPNVLSVLGRSVAATQRWTQEGGKAPGSGAISRARARLGVRPMRRIFQAMVSTWLKRRGEALRWRGMALVALDGTTLRMPDTPANRAHFELHHTGKGRVPASYPILRTVVAVCATTHVALACVAGRFRRSEAALVRRIVRHLPHRTLALLDRGYMGTSFLRVLQEAGHEFIVRRKAYRWMDFVRELAPDDHIVRLPIGRRESPKGWLTLRAINCSRPGLEPLLLLTSLLDAEAFPAEEIVARYRERWECEITFDEIKTHLLGRHVQLRSQSPLLVRQELDGILIAHNLIRMHMEAAASAVQLPPARLSYTDSAVRVREAHVRMAQAPASSLPRMMAAFLMDLATCLLPVRRPRRYERCIKAAPSRYPIRRRPCMA